MRDDIAKLICERQRIGSRSKSIKTALKLDPTLDYDSGDFDWGPTYVSSARHRQEGRCNPVAVNMGKKKGPGDSKNLNENLRPLFQFLEKSVGRPWNDVNSEIRSRIDIRRAIGYHVIQHVGWHVDTSGASSIESWRRYGLYVDDNGILCKAERRTNRYWRQQRKKDQITSLHWYGNVWFKLETLQAPAVCGCVHFKHRKEKPADYPRWRHFDPGPETCVHGNVAGKREIWYVIEYGYHKPDEVFQVHRFEDGPNTAARYNLKEPGDVHIVYYRDVPKLMEKAFEVRRKVANHKELKLIRKAIAEAAGEAAS